MTILRCIPRRPAAAGLSHRTASVCLPTAAHTRIAAGRSRTTQQTPSFTPNSTPSSTRSLYTVPTLDRHADLVAKGIPGLFSKKGFHQAFSANQQHLVDELNLSTQGSQLEGQEIKSLVIGTARDPMKAYLFNVASMAFNNHFFFRGINTNPDLASTTGPTDEVLQQIKKDFSSVDTLRETFIATASAMFGPGFVWLVQLNNNDRHKSTLRILPTYLAGSPLSGAHYRRQSHDLTTHNPDSHAQLNGVGSFGNRAAKPKTAATATASAAAGGKQALGGTDVVPLLCVSTWEHAFLHDYGVAGKDAYLRAWWNKIDWNHVRQNGTWPAREDTGFYYG